MARPVRDERVLHRVRFGHRPVASAAGEFAEGDGCRPAGSVGVLDGDGDFVAGSVVGEIVSDERAYRALGRHARSRRAHSTLGRAGRSARALRADVAAASMADETAGSQTVSPVSLWEV